MISSSCTAEWLDAHRAFNPYLHASDEPTSIKALPLSASSNNAIRLRFEVSDPDGLHQVQLLVLSGSFGLIDCKALNGNSHDTVQFITSVLTPDHKFVALNIIDGHGNILRSTNYPIDVTILQSPDRVFSIPDPNLDAVVRRNLGLSPSEPLTRHKTLHLKSLVIDTEIMDFTGLEHAPGLTRLIFKGNGIISDLSKLSRLTQLTFLQISGNNNISDVSPLAEFTQLTWLLLERNNISDVSPLGELTQLTRLYLSNNNISDVSPLGKLTQLTRLYLSNNNISDVSPLAGLINLEYLKLERNMISDISPLDGLVERTVITWSGNPGFPIGGPKITGPWLWVIVPARHLDDKIDLLAVASGGETTELEIAANGAKEGMAVGNSVWTAHRISTHSDNLNEMRKLLGWEEGIVYGSILIDALEQQQTTMFISCDDACKVWLNGELVQQQQAIVGGAYDYQSFFPVTLENGKNVLLVAIDNRFGGSFTSYFGFAPDAKYTTALPPISAASDTFPEHLDVNTDGVINIQDLVLVASNFGQSGQTDADVNGDGIVNIQDLVLVAEAFGETTSAP